MASCVTVSRQTCPKTRWIPLKKIGQLCLNLKLLLVQWQI
nr:MAG TPA: hypothetical protein [Caudoviricetes sp.]